MTTDPRPFSGIDIEKLILERNAALERVAVLTAENAKLLAGLRWVNSMPVDVDRERNGYNCRACAAPLGEDHRSDCEWEAAMVVLRQHPPDEVTE